MKKRSKYKPKPVYYDAHRRAILGALNVSTAIDAIVEMKAKTHGALVALVRSEADVGDMRKIATASNMSLALLQLGGKRFGFDYKGELETAADAILAVSTRGHPYTPTETELADINLGVDIHDAQLEITSIGLFEKAIHMVKEAQRTKRGRFVGELKCNQALGETTGASAATPQSLHSRLLT